MLGQASGHRWGRMVSCTHPHALPGVRRNAFIIMAEPQAALPSLGAKNWRGYPQNCPGHRNLLSPLVFPEHTLPQETTSGTARQALTLKCLPGNVSGRGDAHDGQGSLNRIPVRLLRTEGLWHLFVYVEARFILWHTYGGQRTTSENQFSPSTHGLWD